MLERKEIKAPICFPTEALADKYLSDLLHLFSSEIKLRIIVKDLVENKEFSWSMRAYKMTDFDSFRIVYHLRR